MDVRDAAELIAPAVRSGQSWADLGAGSGTFTAALAQLVGPAGAVYAVERDASQVRALEQLARQVGHDAHIPITVRRADFTQMVDLPSIDGALLANALHFVAAPVQADALRRIAGHVDVQGSVLIVEYDNRPASRWVPYPISQPRLAVIARQAGLGAPELLGQHRSAYGGTMYAARLRITTRTIIPA